MANHARICSKKKIDPKEVTKIIKGLNEDILAGVFTIEYQHKQENGWGNINGMYVINKTRGLP